MGRCGRVRVVVLGVPMELTVTLVHVIREHARLFLGRLTWDAILPVVQTPVLRVLHLVILVVLLGGAEVPVARVVLRVVRRAEVAGEARVGVTRPVVRAQIVIVVCLARTEVGIMSVGGIPVKLAVHPTVATPVAIVQAPAILGIVVRLVRGQSAILRGDRP